MNMRILRFACNSAISAPLLQKVQRNCEFEIHILTKKTYIKKLIFIVTKNVNEKLR